MTTTVDTVIIGAGSAGLSALKQVQQSTDDYVLIDPGPLGTTCARVGCMPSKVLIHVANSYHRRHDFAACGIEGGDNLLCDIPSVLRHVRKMRDMFTRGMQEVTHKRAGDRLVTGKARFTAPDTLCVGDEMIRAKRIIIATGSRPRIPEKWSSLGDRLLTSDNIFEQEDLPRRVAVVGLGAIGLELGQAFSRLGIQVAGFDLTDKIGGLSDPAVNETAVRIIGREFPLHGGHPAEIVETRAGLSVKAGDTEVLTDKVLLAAGVVPNLQELGLEVLGVDLDEHGQPHFDRRTLQIGNLPVFIAGDVNGCRPILHEAIDEGFIAGRNAHADGSACFCRRTPLRMVFSDPGIATVGRAFRECEDMDIIVGEADFSDQARAQIEGTNAGLLRIYVEKASLQLVGAEMAVPDAEHFAHYLALAVSRGIPLSELLHVPYYHPTTEEGVRTALKTVMSQVDEGEMPSDLSLCGSCPEDILC